MPLKIKRTRRIELSQEQIDFFLAGDDFVFFWDEWERSRDWRAVKDELLDDFIAEHPGRRPFFWWVVDAPEPRRRTGGKGDLVPAYSHPTNLKFGIFRKGCFVDAELLRAWNKIGCATTRPPQVYDADDPPRYESQAAFLDRHGLLTVAERKALPPDAFEPEVVR